LIRLFHRRKDFHEPDELELKMLESRGISGPLEDELRIYTWPDACMGEIAALVSDALPHADVDGCRLVFRLLYRSSSGKLMASSLGEVRVGKPSAEDGRGIVESGFEVGDFIDCGVF